jgi:hypothetical protein
MNTNGNCPALSHGSLFTEAVGAHRVWLRSLLTCAPIAEEGPGDCNFAKMSDVVEDSEDCGGNKAS